MPTGLLINDVTLMLPIVNKYKNHPYGKYGKYIIIALLIITFYKLYVWLNTESTDNAYIESDISIISSEVSGTLKKVFVGDNSKVKYGDIIAEIEDEEYKAKFDKACATVEGSVLKSKIIEQQILIKNTRIEKLQKILAFTTINLELSLTDYKRTSELSKDSYASQKLLDNAKLTYEKAKSENDKAIADVEINKQQLKALELEKAAIEQEIKAAKNERQIAERNLYHTKIRAPISGAVANSSLKVGNYIRSGISLFLIVPDLPLFIKANFKETQVHKFKPGMTVTITVDSTPRKKFKGIIRSLSPATGSKFSLIPPDNATGNFTKVVQRVPTLIDFDPPQELSASIAPGMSAIAAVRTDQ